MKKLVLAVLFLGILGFAGQVLACGISGKNAGTDGSSKNLASEYSLTGK